MLLMLLAPSKADFTDTGCPPASSFTAYPTCTCHTTNTTVNSTEPFFKGNSVGLLTFYCGGSKSSFTDSDADYIISQIPATTPIENFGLFAWSLTKIPAGLSQYTTLSGIAFPDNNIVSLSASEVTWPSLMAVNLYNNSITSISGNFSFSTTNSDGTVSLNMAYNQISSLDSSTSFNMISPYKVLLTLYANNFGTVDSTFNLFATGPSGTVTLDMSYGKIALLTSSAIFDLSASYGANLYLNNNNITSVGSTFNLAGTNSSQGSVYLTLSNNQITSLASATFSLTAGSSGAQLYLTYNAITSVNGSAITFQSPYSSSLSLHHNAITSLSGNFNLNCSDPNGEANLYLYNNQLTSLSPATFYLNGVDYVWLDFSNNQLTSISAGTITLQSSTYIGLDLSYNDLTTLSLGSDTNPPLSDGQDIYLYNNNLTSINCNDLAINAGAAYNYIDISRNQVTSVKCGANSPLNSSQQVYLYLSYNSLTAINSGDLNFNGLVYLLSLKNQNAVFNSIAPGALPSKFKKYKI